MYSISYSRNIDVKLNLTVGKINFVLPNFTVNINTCIKLSKCLHFNIEAYFQTAKCYYMSLYKFSRSINSTKVPVYLAYGGFISSLNVLG